MVGVPRTQMLSLKAMGTPARGASAGPGATVSATVMKALLPPWAAAKKLGVHPSTASRTRIRAEWRLSRLVGVYRQGDRRAVDWDETCRAMAAEYGIGLGAVYKILGGLERGAGGPGLFQRQLLRRAEAGMSIKEIAAELEVSERAVRRAM